MKMVRSSRFISGALLLSSLAFLPACNPFEWFKDSSCGCACQATDVEVPEGVSPELLKEPVVEFDGKVVATGADYERTFNLLLEAQPAFRDMMKYLPPQQLDQVYKQLLETLALEKVILRAVDDMGLKSTPEYKKNAQRVHESVDRDLAVNAFQNELLKEVVITDEEAKKFYDENHATDSLFQRPPFVVTLGGVKAEGFEVPSQKVGLELAEKARKGNFAAVAKEAKKSVIEYGIVSPQSMVDKDIKEAVLKVGPLPKIEVVRAANGKYYVVRMISRQDTHYATFDAVKDAVKQLLTQKKFNELYQQRIAELKDKYKVVVREGYLEKRAPKAVEAAPAEEASAEEPHSEEENDKNIGA